MLGFLFNIYIKIILKMKHIKSFNQMNEGKTEKANKSKDKDVKKELLRDKVKDFLKSKSCKVEQVGNDLSIYISKDHIAQIMFRDDKITVKKEGNKFGKDFKYDELGKIKSEISSIIKNVD
jgi:hypothetical protein